MARVILTRRTVINQLKSILTLITSPFSKAGSRHEYQAVQKVATSGRLGAGSRIRGFGHLHHTLALQSETLNRQEQSELKYETENRYK